MQKSKLFLNLFKQMCMFCLILAGVSMTIKAQKWKQYSDVEKAGWSSEKLEEARQFAAEIGSATVLIVDRGNVVSAWGHIDHPYKSASIRKSIYDATMGATHFQKPFNLNASVDSLKIDDIKKLSDQEKTATLENLMTARSGIYHPAAYETRSNAKRRPKRFSAAPGKFWYYNNWDFNVTAIAFNKLTQKTIEEAFVKNLAIPLGMEDFEKNHVFRWREPRLSKHPAVTFRLSARDLARIGQLYLNQGKWENKRIVSEKWIKRSTTPFTTFEENHYRGAKNGYGRLWWIFPARSGTKSSYQKYQRIAALGAGGQIMVLIPKIDVLIVHLADTNSGRGVNDGKVITLLNKILDAKTKPKESKSLQQIKIKKLSDKKPITLREDYSLISKKRRADLEGVFMFTDKIGVKFYQTDSRLFLQPLGMPLSDAEVFQVSDGSLRSPLVNLVVLPTENKTGGKIKEIMMSFRGRQMKGIRKDQ